MEYDLGNGLYGYRATGTITASASIRNVTLLKSGISELVSYGGYWMMGTGQIIIGGGTPLASGLTGFYTLASIDCDSSGNVNLKTIANQARTDAAYSVWITYTK